MNRFGKAGKLLAYTVGAVTGLGGVSNSGGAGTGRPGEEGDGNTGARRSAAKSEHPLSGINLNSVSGLPWLQPVIGLLSEIAEGRYLYSSSGASAGSGKLEEFVHRGVGTFLQYYSRPEQAEKVDAVLELFDSGVEPELLAEAISKVWMPELEMDDKSILDRWRLSDLKANREPVKPEQVLLQLNALYTVPEKGAEGRISRLPERLQQQAREVQRDPGKKMADYDHPVHLYEEDGQHELIGCLRELDEEIGFEKEQGVLPKDHAVPVLLSVSVTHEGIDQAAGDWIEWLLESKHYHHLHVFVLTETMVRHIKDALDGTFPAYSVFGKYGRHFNALKYSQLLFEKSHGIRAGFKLDTDEGIRSRDLYAARGKTWFQILCHPYWGGTAVDWKGRSVLLAVNEGEYINSSDIDKHGYSGSLRTPDVAIPNSWSGPNMFFQKGFAHGRTTGLYNTFNNVEDGISHTVVKGGGYGITNQGLRNAAPFTFSWVGRAEDQQFYFSGLPEGIRGIFHPDLRIAHYKASVRGAEEKTAATRFIGDMYRLIIFQRLAELMDVKSDIDPMPGVFAGELAQAQAAFATLLKSVEFASRGEEETGRYVVEEGVQELVDLEHRIDRGEVERELHRERQMWRDFIEAADSADPVTLKKIWDGSNPM
ncbi:MAG: hypothetical protein ACP5IA_01155 [Sediminispirochaetaceae bacterium]